MKATKFLIVIAIFAFVSMSYAKTDKLPHPLKITLRQACENRGMVLAIYQQIKPGPFLQNDQNTYYNARVYFQRRVFIIYGKYEEWVDFFNRNGKDQPNLPKTE